MARLASEHNLPLKVNYNGNWGYHIQLPQSKIHISESDLPPVFVQVSNCYPSFLNIFLGVIQLDNVVNSNSWISQGIIISCKHKRELCVESRYSKLFHKKNIKRIIIKYFQKAELLEYDELVLKSSN